MIMGTKMMVRVLLLAVLLPGLGGCRYLTGENGWFRDRQGDYLRAPIEPALQVPDNLDSFTLDQLFVIPPEREQATAEFIASVPRPKPLDTNRPEGVVIQRIGGEAWIVIAATPQQVWPRVRDFWIGRSQVLDYENPVEGIIETGWVDAASDLTRVEKFRVRIEPGLRPGSSELYIFTQERLRTTPPPVLPIWPATAANDGSGYTVLEQLSQYLADRTDIYSSSSASLLAGSLAGESKSNLVAGADGMPRLDLRIGMVRAWAQVGQALERAELSVISSDRDQGLYQVRFAGVDADTDAPGFFGRLLGRGDSGNEDDIPQFDLRLETTDTGVSVSVTTEPGTADGAQLAEELLQAVLSNLG